MPNMLHSRLELVLLYCALNMAGYDEVLWWSECPLATLGDPVPLYMPCARRQYCTIAVEHLAMPATWAVFVNI
jgi:hypothetical protein